MTSYPQFIKPNLLQRLDDLFSLATLRDRVFKSVGFIIAFMSTLAGIITYVLLTERPVLAADDHHFYWLVGLDVLLLFLLSCVVGMRVWRVWSRRKQRLAGAQLHIKLMTTFSALAAIPAILVAVFAVVFIHQGVQAWFGERIRTAVEQSEAVAQAYLEEHQQSIRADVLAMANDLNRASMRAMSDPEFLQDFFRTQTYLRNLSEAVLVDSTGDIIARGGLSISMEFMPVNLKKMLEEADNNEVVLFMGENEDRVRAIVKLDGYIDTYLFVGRFVDENVLASVISTTKAVNAYEALEQKQSQLKLTMTLIFAMVALMLLLVALWTGLSLAQRIVDPLAHLIYAAERVRAGDLNARVEETAKETEVGTLARAFNRMTEQLRNQRKDLIDANRQLDERRRFTETVLAGVNAGVIGMDEKGTIQIANASAQRLMQMDAHDMVGKRLASICPEMETVRRVLRSKPGRSVEIPIDIDAKENSAESHWIVRMTAEGADDELRGYVATFDDLSPMMDAQRKAAWADVARRVAHEIKNPLTPIQLSAERLKRRYSQQIVDDRETFEACTDTIVRQVEDIRTLIDEFNAFARMPNSAKQTENIVNLCQQVLVLFQQGHANAVFEFERPDHPIPVPLDRQQITQALTNIIKNAFEATQEIHTEGFKPRIDVSLHDEGRYVVLQVSDNGSGWPADLLPRLTDPYVTTKVTGTGLGLAIVAKIVEDHQGKIEFLNNAPQGATVRIVLPKGEQHG